MIEAIEKYLVKVGADVEYFGEDGEEGVQYTIHDYTVSIYESTILLVDEEGREIKLHNLEHLKQYI